MKAKNIIRYAVGTGLILAVPLVAMQFSEEVNWGLADFVIIGTLLMGIGLTYEFLSTKLRSRKQRLILSAVLIVILVYLWAELAVGIFTNWGS